MISCGTCPHWGEDHVCKVLKGHVHTNADDWCNTREYEVRDETAEERVKHNA